MNKSVIIPAVFSALGLTGAGSFTGYNLHETSSDPANTINERRVAKSQVKKTKTNPSPPTKRSVSSAKPNKGRTNAKKDPVVKTRKKTPSLQVSEAKKPRRPEKINKTFPAQIPSTSPPAESKRKDIVYADVLNVRPITKTIKGPRQECRDEKVSRLRSTENNTQEAYTTTETRCDIVFGTKKSTIGYDVQYQLGKRIRYVRMNKNPGDRIPVIDGKLVLR